MQPTTARVRTNFKTHNRPPPVSRLQPSVLANTLSGLLQQEAEKGMDLHDTLTGRKEKRLPVLVIVNLALLEPLSPERYERTYTDNISAHGARVRSTYAWQRGEEAEITPASGETPVRGEVVYCQRLDSDRFFVGVKIRESGIPWSILRMFDGRDTS